MKNTLTKDTLESPEFQSLLKEWNKKLESEGMPENLPVADVSNKYNPDIEAVYQMYRDIQHEEVFQQLTELQRLLFTMYADGATFRAMHKTCQAMGYKIGLSQVHSFTMEAIRTLNLKPIQLRRK